MNQSNIRLATKIAVGFAGLATALAIGSAGSAQAAIFSANLSGDQVVPSTPSTATGLATFNLNEDKTELAYTIALQGVNLKAGAANRTEPSDVNKIHIHTAPRGENGPHVLNIFGLPAEEDSDLTVDYAANTLSGVWDDSDATDTNGNGVIDANDSKLLTEFISALESGNLYVQVHTLQFDTNSGSPGELRGQVLAQSVEPGASTPEPLGVVGLLGVAAIAGTTLRQRGSVTDN